LAHHLWTPQYISDFWIGKSIFLEGQTTKKLSLIRAAGGENVGLTIEQERRYKSGKMEQLRKFTFAAIISVSVTFLAPHES